MINLSEHGLKIDGQDNSNVVFSGTRAQCLKAIYAHGVTLGKKIYRLDGIEDNMPMNNTNVVIGHELEDMAGNHVGMMNRCKVGFSVILNIEIWRA